MDTLRTGQPWSRPARPSRLVVLGTVIALVLLTLIAAVTVALSVPSATFPGDPWPTVLLGSALVVLGLALASASPPVVDRLT